MPSDPLHDSPEKVFAQFDDAGPVDLMDLHRGLHEAAGASAAQVWRADLLASDMRPYPTKPSPWGGYFGPRFTAEFENGEVVERPALSEADEEVLATWRGRAETLVAPTLKAHYANLVWDLGPQVSGGRREPAFARLAVEAYRAAAADPREQRLHAFSHLSRALTIAIQLDDQGLVDAVRAGILELHRKAVRAGELWWRAYDILSPQRKAGLTDAEKALMISDLEAALAGYADQGDPKRFEVHFVERTGERLVKHYRQATLSGEEKRIRTIIARAREHHAARSEALAASSILNESMDAYRKAGLAEDAEPVRRLMQARLREARDQMAEISHPNLRNEVAHGLLSRHQIQEGTVLWLSQTILHLGLWRAPAPADAAIGPERSGKSV
jgi:lysyl-tRNA synthetase class 1